SAVLHFHAINWFCRKVKLLEIEISSEVTGTNAGIVKTSNEITAGENTCIDAVVSVAVKLEATLQLHVTLHLIGQGHILAVIDKSITRTNRGSLQIEPTRQWFPGSCAGQGRAGNASTRRTQLPSRSSYDQRFHF